MTAPSLRTGPAAGRKCRGRWLAAPVPKGLTVSCTSGAEEAAVADIRRPPTTSRLLGWYIYWTTEWGAQFDKIVHVVVEHLNMALLSEWTLRSFYR